MGLNKNYNVIIIGAGNLGQAVANYTRFERLGFQVLALFDINPKLIGIKIRDIPVLDMDELRRIYSGTWRRHSHYLCPKDSAQEITDRLSQKCQRHLEFLHLLI